MTVIGFAGPAGSGKTTAAEFLRRTGRHSAVIMSFADPLRAMACSLYPRLERDIARYGYVEAKQRFPYIREYLQWLGTDVVRHHLGDGVWVDALCSRVDQALTRGHSVIIDDVRFLNEALMITDAFGGQLFKVTGRAYADTPDHVSERCEFSAHEIDNSGTLQDFYNNLDKEVRW